ncbi:MAG: T9SS type A sorting domain-containing protein [Cytophagales bacterium]
MVRFLSLFFYFFIFNNVLFSQDTVSVISYNLLRFNSSTERNLHFRNIIEKIKPDVLITQEMIGQESVNNFLNNILKNINEKYKAADFIDDEDTDIDQGLFYNSNKFSFISTSQIDGYPRPVYIFTLKHLDTGEQFVVYNLHLKASKGSENELARSDQVKELKNYISETNSNFYIVAGDFNIYSTTESAYKDLFSITESGKGNLHDLINVVGTYNDPSNANIHTQSTRTSQFGGGSHGGLDDRFDFILFSDSLMYGDRIFVIDSTYKSFGNDGMHYNSALNVGPNQEVSMNIANSLHDASDHLPVLVKIIFSNEKIHREVLNVESYSVSDKLLFYPNPSKNKLNIQSDDHKINKLEIYSLNGTKILDKNINSNSCTIDVSKINIGNYLIILNFKNFTQKIKFVKK